MIQPTAGTAGEATVETFPRKVSPDTLERTRKCAFSMRCLDGERLPMCRVERQISDRYLFVKCDTQINCAYRIAFGLSSHVCGCPTRNELYRTYGI